MSTAQSRGALEQLQTVGDEDTKQRASLDIKHPLYDGAVGTHALDGALSAIVDTVSNRELVALVAVADSYSDAHSLLTEAHKLALVSCTQRVPGAAEVERLQEIGLTGAVGAVDDCQPLAKLRLRPGVELRKPRSLMAVTRTAVSHRRRLRTCQTGHQRRASHSQQPTRAARHSA